MQNYRISLNDLSPEGKEFTLDDAAIWQEPMDEFGLDFRVSKPLRARILVLPTDGGWLVMEIGYDQSADVEKLLLIIPFAPVL